MTTSGQDEGNDAERGSHKKAKTHKPPDNGIRVIISAFHGLYDDGWTQNSVVSIIALCVSPLLTFMFLQSPKGMLYGFGIGATIALWGVILAVGKHIDHSSPPNNMPQSPGANPPQNQTISSTNQSGGITAHTVNIFGEPKKPLKLRIRECLDSINKDIAERSVKGALVTVRDVPLAKFEELKKLSEEPDAPRYFSIISVASFNGMTMGNTPIAGSVITELRIEPELAQQ